MNRGDDAGLLFLVPRFAAPDAHPLSGAAKRVIRRWLASDRAFEKAIGWPRVRLKELHLREHGPLVIDGPFKGMQLAGAWSELPKFLGCYEHDLHTHVLAAAARGYQSVLNIGCAEGYYAIGFARLIPSCTVYAFDIDAEQRRRCAINAEANGMAARVIIGGAFDGASFADHPANATLVVCDIEGAEDVLLDPELWPALCSFDLLVELHLDVIPNQRHRFEARFAHSHTVTIVPPSGGPLRFLRYYAEMDRLAAGYENRWGENAWMILRARS